MNQKRQEIIKKAYDAAAEKYGEMCFFELYDKPLDKKLYDLFFERVVNKGMALEIGCGPGEVCNYIKMKGLDIIGIDISENMIKAAKRFNPLIDFRVGDVFNLEFRDGSIAGVAAPYLIVNFEEEDLIKAFKEIHRVLIEKGQLLISFHSGNEKCVIDDFFAEGNSIPFTYFDSDEVKNRLVESGFDIIEYINRMPYEGEITKRTFIFAEKRCAAG